MIRSALPGLSIALARTAPPFARTAPPFARTAPPFARTAPPLAAAPSVAFFFFFCA